jgi:hypothetical protein
MEMQEFAEQHRLRTCRDGCGAEIIVGKLKALHMPDRAEYASHVYDGFDGGRLGVCLFYSTARRWNAMRKKLVDVGCLVRQDGDIEGCLTFNPLNKQQTRAVLKAARIHPLRKTAEPSPAQIAARAAFAARSRVAQTPAQASF